jgi:hypothetical protein
MEASAIENLNKQLSKPMNAVIFAKVREIGVFTSQRYDQVKSALPKATLAARALDDYLIYKRIRCAIGSYKKKDVEGRLVGGKSTTLHKISSVKVPSISPSAIIG